jgi:hypothetical protein
MGAGLKVRLHVLVPAVENAVAGNAFRPGDVLRSRKGLTVEIGNTDAEGRLVLADALTRASEEQPAMVLDFATLTGAARVALGPDLPALMARRDDTAEALLAAGPGARRPVLGGCRCPRPMPSAQVGTSRRHQTTRTATASPDRAWRGCSSTSSSAPTTTERRSTGATITTPFAWRPSAKPGRPKGGDALGLRAAWHICRARFGYPPRAGPRGRWQTPQAAGRRGSRRITPLHHAASRPVPLPGQSSGRIGEGSGIPPLAPPAPPRLIARHTRNAGTRRSPIHTESTPQGPFRACRPRAEGGPAQRAAARRPRAHRPGGQVLRAALRLCRSRAGSCRAAHR